MEFFEVLLIIYVIAVILSGLAHDLANAIMCGILGIIVLIINICLSASGEGFELAFQSGVTNNDFTANLFAHCLFLYIFFVIRYIPCVKVNEEKYTYLIFGTLIEETETVWVGLGTMFGVPLLLTVGAYFLGDLLLNLGFIYINYVFTILGILHCVIGVVRAIIANYLD